MVFQSNSSIKFNNHTFPEGISCKRSVRLIAAEVKGDLIAQGSIKLLKTPVSGRIQANYCVKLLDQSTAGSVQARNSVILMNSTVQTSVETLGTLKAEDSKMESVKAESFVNLIRSQILQSIRSSNSIRCSSSTLGSISTEGSVTLTDNSCVTCIESASFVDAESATIERLHVKGSIILKDVRAEEVSSSEGYIHLEKTKINKTVQGRSNVTVKESEVHSVKSETSLLSIDHSSVHGDAFTPYEVYTCNDSVIEGTLTCSNRRLELIRSTVNEVVVQADSILPNLLKRLTDEGRITLEANQITVGHPQPNAEYVLIDFCSVPMRCYGEQPRLLYDRSDVSYSALVFTDFVLRAGSISEVQQAIRDVLNGNVLPLEEQKLELQTIILQDSYVKKIVFEKQCGVVYLLGASKVETVEGGTIFSDIESSTESISAN